MRTTLPLSPSPPLLVPHKKSKHFGIEWAFFKEAVELKEISPVIVSTDEQPADMMTKSLVSGKFQVFRDMVMGDPILQDHFGSENYWSHILLSLV